MNRKARHMAGSYGFLSTHAPTQCGLATFNTALATHLTSDDSPGGVVRVATGRPDGGGRGTARRATPAPAPAHLGVARPGKGHRVGAAGIGPAAGSPTGGDLHRRRPDPSQGPRVAR